MYVRCLVVDVDRPRRRTRDGQARETAGEESRRGPQVVVVYVPHTTTIPE